MSDKTEIAMRNASLTPASTNEVPAVNNTFHLDQSGDGTNIGVAQNVNQNTYQIYMPGVQPQYGGMNQTYAQPFHINTDYYNLFVMAGETYSGPYVLLDLDRALTSTYGTSEYIRDKFAVFTEDAIAAIKTFPSIFAGENYRYCKPDFPTDGQQYAHFGFVTDVKVGQNRKVKVYFQLMPMCSIPQELLNHMLSELDILGHYKMNEFDKTHWAIKKVNLIEEMKLKGVSLFVPSVF